MVTVKIWVDRECCFGCWRGLVERRGLQAPHLSAFRQPVLSLGLGAGAAATEDAFVLLWIHVDGCISRCIQWQEHPPTGLHYEERKGASEEVNWSQKSVEHDKACSIIAPATGKKKGSWPFFQFCNQFQSS